MGYNSIPPRWEEYSNIGTLIPGTKIIPFKVPLRKEICQHLSDNKLRFTVNDLITQLGDIKLSMVIDLTQTTRFYNGEDLNRYNIKYVKFSTRGGGCMPTESEVKRFCDTIADHLLDNSEAFVGVHCTHGLNRTGYFICRYMIDYLGFCGSASVQLFEESRGHRFDRDNYRQSLMDRTAGKDMGLSIDNYRSASDKYNGTERADHSHSSGNANNNKQRYTRPMTHNENFMNRNSYSGDHGDRKPAQIDYRDSRSPLKRNSSDQASYSDYRSYKLARKSASQEQHSDRDPQSRETKNRSVDGQRESKFIRESGERDLDKFRDNYDRSSVGRRMYRSDKYS